MGRTKGSKNKLKDIDTLQEEKQTYLLSLAEKVKEVLKEAEPIVKVKHQKEIHSGWINIQQVEYKPNKFAYHSGSDIHETEEKAKEIASKNTVAQAYIRWSS